jgi:hypothetical protein
VDLLLPKLLVVYLNFAHSDAWDTVVDFFGPTPLFRGSLEGREIKAAAGGLTWNTSISIPHFIPRPTHGVNGVDTPSDFPSACISICMTGDNLGEFWTCSILGYTNPSQQDGNYVNLPPGFHDKTRTVLEDLEKYKYDKYSTRNLIFVLYLTEVCNTISERYESVLDKLKAIIDVKVTDPSSLDCYLPLC